MFAAIGVTCGKRSGEGSFDSSLNAGISNIRTLFAIFHINLSTSPPTLV